MRRVVLGQKSTGLYGLWVSKPGYDAVSGGVDDYLLSTSISTTQVFLSGSLSTPIYTGDYRQNIVNVYHGLGYIPTWFLSGSFANIMVRYADTNYIYFSAYTGTYNYLVHR